MIKNNNQTAVAVFGGGCFWCTEAVFSALKGVISVIPGYTGGARPNPTYEQVCSGATGHAESIKIEFDPKKIKYRDLLEIFFATHDPTTLNRQGPDVGTEYRSVIFYSDAEQKKESQKIINELAKEKIFNQPIITELQPLDVFYPAEEYHHKFFEKNPEQSYCQAIINPKITKFKKKYSHFLK